MILGYLNPEELAGGGIKVDFERCLRVFKRELAEPLGLSLHEAAMGVHRIANANMQKAIRAVTVERGRNPAHFAMLAFGGSGPVHGATLASSMNISEVIIPAAAGLFSALGLLFADLTCQLSRTYFHKVDHLSWSNLRAAAADMRAQASAVLTAEHIDARQQSVQVSADVRYVGQSHELPVLISQGASQLIDRATLSRTFTAEYLNRYGHSLPDGELEIVNLHVEARRVSADPRSWVQVKTTQRSRAERRCYFPHLGFVTTAIIGRGSLGAELVPGPMIIEEYDSTTVVPPAWTAALDEHGNIRLRAEEHA
jgi:N-methylhydantoinase A